MNRHKKGKLRCYKKEVRKKQHALVVKKDQGENVASKPIVQGFITQYNNAIVFLTIGLLQLHVSKQLF